MSQNAEDKTKVVLTELDFDSLETLEVPVRYKGVQYVAVEADEKAARLYRNALLACMTLGGDGKPQSLRNLANVEPLLVSNCLYTVKVDKDGNPLKDEAGKFMRDKLVPATKIEGWQSKVVKKIFDTIKEISDLNEESPERKALLSALKIVGAPVSLDDFRKWVGTLQGDEYKPLQKLLQPSEEELAKNEQSDTPDGSE